jgi:hypothetical protein
VSLTTAVKVSEPVLPLSDKEIPEIVSALPTPATCAPGTVIASPLVTLTAIVCCVATLPKLSVALTLIVSAPAVESVSVADASAASTSASEPEMVTESVPLPVTVEPFAVKERFPWVSLTDHRVSLGRIRIAALGHRDPRDRQSLADTGSVCAPGTVIDGSPLTVTPMVCCVAAWPKLSVALTLIVSAPAVESVSLSDASAAFTSVSEPAIVTESVPLPVSVEPSAVKLKFPLSVAHHRREGLRTRAAALGQRDAQRSSVPCRHRPLARPAP